MQLQLFAVTAFSLLATARAAPEVTADALAKGINELAKVSNTTDMLLTPMTKDDVTDVMPVSTEALGPIFHRTDTILRRSSRTCKA